MYSLTVSSAFTLLTDDLYIYYTGHTGDIIATIPNAKVVSGSSIIERYTSGDITLYSATGIEIDTSTGNKPESGASSTISITLTYNYRSIA